MLRRCAAPVCASSLRAQPHRSLRTQVYLQCQQRTTPVQGTRLPKPVNLVRCAPHRRRFTEQAKPPAKDQNLSAPQSTNQPTSPPPPLWRRILTRLETDSPYRPYSREWWTDKAIVFGVFGVTGSSTMFFVRPLLTDFLHLQSGTWTYLVASILLISPCYTVLLVLLGTLAGRKEYFTKIARRMWGRFLPFLREKKKEEEAPKK